MRLAGKKASLTFDKVDCHRSQVASTAHLAAKTPGWRGPKAVPLSTPRIGCALARRQLEKNSDAIASGYKTCERHNSNHMMNSILAQTCFLPGLSLFPVRQIGRCAQRVVQ